MNRKHSNRPYFFPINHDKTWLIGIMGQDGIDRGQIVLASACNAKRAKLHWVDKALRLGAQPNRACNIRGNLPFHSYARHGTSAYEASWLMAKGFNPMAQDAEGRCFAHHAFMSHNLTLARWVVAVCPESWRAKDVQGLTPMNLCCVHNWQDTENLDGIFKNWAWNALPDDCRALFTDTAWLGLILYQKKQRFGGHQQEAAWLSSKNIAIDDAEPVLAELNRLAQIDPGSAEAFAPGIMGAIALGESRHIGSALARPEANTMQSGCPDPFNIKLNPVSKSDWAERARSPRL